MFDEIFNTILGTIKGIVSIAYILFHLLILGLGALIAYIMFVA